MLLKRKIVHPIVTSAREIESEIGLVNLAKLREFQKEISLADPKHIWGILRSWHEKLFNEFPNPEVHYQMLMLRIQYELTRLDYVEQKIVIPVRLNQNIIASKHYDINGLVPSLKGIMESLTKGENMATTTVKKTVSTNRVPGAVAKSPVVAQVTKTGKVSKETVTQTYTRIFQENAKKKLNDIQLAAEMVKAHPDKKKYSVADIKSVRSMYNRGVLSGQKGAPASASFVVAAK